MPFGIPSEDFHGGFGIPEETDSIEADRDEQVRLITRALIEAGVVQGPAYMAVFLFDYGVRVIKG